MLRVANLPISIPWLSLDLMPKTNIMTFAAYIDRYENYL